MNPYRLYALFGLMTTLLIAPALGAEQSVPLTLHARGANAGMAWPVTFGVPFPEGALTRTDGLRLLGPDGEAVPVQARPTARWFDDSIQWVLIDASLQLPAEAAKYQLSWAPDAPRAAPAAAQVTYQEHPDRIVVNTGALEFTVSKQRLTLFEDMRVRNDAGEWVAVFPYGEYADFYLENRNGTGFFGNLSADSQVVIEEPGPQRVSIKLEGWMRSADGRKLGRRIVRIYAFAGMDSLKIYDTFVNTADTDEVKFANISLRLPFVGKEYRFHGAGMDRPQPVGEDAYLLQYEHDAFEVVADGQVRSRGERAPGHVTVSQGPAAYTVAWRHFWQMYPNEIEVRPGQLNLHFWPRHGKPAEYRADPGKVTVKNLPQLRWVHEGEVLDFTPPDSVIDFEYPDYPRDYSDNNINRIPDANAFGITRTSEYWLDFHGEAPPAETASRIEAFEHSPLVLADPQWMAGSQAFWNIAPYDDQYAELERATAKMLDFYPAMYEPLGDYGKWLFGGYHQDYHPTLEYAGIHRTWPGLHHGMPRWPWLTLVRSGDPHYFTFAENLSNYLLDMWIVQWEDQEFNARKWEQPSPPYRHAGKYRGGVTAYSAVVPWYQGMEVSFNAQVDFALWYYYLTGYQRAWDVAMMEGELLLREESLLRQETGMADAGRFPPDDLFPIRELRDAYFRDHKGSMHNLLTPGRQGTGPASAALQLYRATHDDRYLAIARRVVDHNRQIEDETGDAYSNIYYAPLLGRYWDVTRDKGVKPYIVKWAKDRMTIDGRQWDGRDQYYDQMALAYQLTRDPAFLEHGIAQTQVVLDNRFARNMGEDLAGTPYWAGGPSGVGYAGQQWGRFQRALQEHYERTGERLALPGPTETYPFTSLVSSTPRGPRQQIDFRLRKGRGEAIDFKMRLNSEGDDAVKLTLFDTSGKEMPSQIVETRPVEGRDQPSASEATIRIQLRADMPAGDYRIRLRSRSRIDVFWPKPEGYMKLVVESPVRLSPRLGPPLRVFMPVGATLELTLAEHRHSDFSTHRLYNADGEEVFAFTARGRVNTPNRFQVPVPPDQRGRPWFYRRSSSQSEGRDLHIKGMAPFWSYSKEAFFLPESYKSIVE